MWIRRETIGYKPPASFPRCRCPKEQWQHRKQKGIRTAWQGTLAQPRRLAQALCDSNCSCFLHTEFPSSQKVLEELPFACSNRSLAYHKFIFCFCYVIHHPSWLEEGEVSDKPQSRTLVLVPALCSRICGVFSLHHPGHRRRKFIHITCASA